MSPGTETRVAPMVTAFKVVLKWDYPGLFSIYFRLFKHKLQFLQQINVKNVHLVNGAGIQTHDLWSLESPPITTRPGLLPAFKVVG